MLRVLVLGLFISGALIFFASRLGKRKGIWTMVTVLAAVWLAIVLGWAAGEWVGILAITMPSLIILIAGLLALPPFVLPVPALPWKGPTVVATLYTVLWLVSVWDGWLEMDAIGLFVFLSGLLVIFRPALPLASTQPPVAIGLFVALGFVSLFVWRGLDPFQWDRTLELLVLVQGVLALSTYFLPVAGKNMFWAWQLAALFGVSYLLMMFAGNIQVTVTNGLILLLGLAAFLRFAIPLEEKDRRWTDSVVTVLIFVQYGFTWAIGIAAGQLAIDWFSTLTFGIGLVTTLMPALVPPSDNWAAFKAIMTYNLGTNYPYQAVPFRELVTRAEGNAFAKLLAGPGIVLSNADHAVVIYGAGSFARVSHPGLTFTHWAEEVKEIVDLRPQARSTSSIVVKTKDGIDVKVAGSTPFRIETQGRDPELGDSFPYDEEAIHTAVHAQRVDQEAGQALGWDKLLPQVGERAVRDIIAAYTLDELSSLFEPEREPAAEISARMRDQVREKAEGWGLELLGGGIGNIDPPPEVIEQRIQYWKAHWERKISALEAEAEADARRRIEIARAEAQMEMLLRITEGLEHISDLDPDRRRDLMVLRLLNAFGRAVSAYPALASWSSVPAQLAARLPDQLTGGLPGPTLQDSSAGGNP